MDFTARDRANRRLGALIGISLGALLAVYFLAPALEDVGGDRG